MEKNNRRNLLVLAFTLAVMMLGYGVVIPVMPFYIEQMGASGTQLGLLVASYGVIKLVFAPMWGSVSDRIGRKPVLMLGVLGNGLAMLFFGLATQLWMLFAARILAGLLSSATSPTAFAYIGDSTSEKGRSGGMGMLGAAVGAGTILGPGLGGWLAGDSLATPFYFTAAMCLLSLVLIWLFLPESLPEAHGSQRAAPAPVESRPSWRRALGGQVGWLLVLNLLAAFGLAAFYGIFGLYAQARYGYGPEQVGTILVVAGIVSMAAQGALAGPLSVRWGEAVVIRLAFAGSAAGFGIMLLPGDLAGVLLTTGLFVLAISLLVPPLTALISVRSTGGQGVAMGWANAVMSLGRSLGPLAAGVAFDANLSLPYLGGAVAMFVGLIGSMVWASREAGSETTGPPGRVVSG